MQDILNANDEEVSEIKLWLFKENIRIQAQAQELKDKEEAFYVEQQKVKRQLREESRKIELMRAQNNKEKLLIDEKWKALKRGFDELDEDRRQLKRQEQRLLDYRRELEELPIMNQTSGTMFFRGVSDKLSLKKRYKDLIKIFHPDNLAGDKETVLSISQEYDELSRRFN